ncbi:MAG: excinuclease ABC subunit UvrA [Prolixibacteraceae bacterium]|jgi:excinuclease ABC subunit A|nr:excinuclease ABC subunit UvrA [Prolixibacteraceae bacterium]
MSKDINNQYIEIRGAKVHNLKNIDIRIPRNKLVVITGLSGSGKSSLAFDTLYAEGQRRYVESLSSYARQFLGRMDKPEVDYIKGIPPAIAIEQKVNTRNPRSTVGTSTEIYDYIKLLYARIGRTFSPVSGNQVMRHEVVDVVNYLASFPIGTKITIVSPLQFNKGRSLTKEAELLLQQGFTRLELDGEIIKISDLGHYDKKPVEINILIDRIPVSEDEDFLSRIADSVQTAFFEGKGECLTMVGQGKILETRKFSNRFELDGITFEEPSLHLFSFNNPIGACPICEGYGKTIGIDEDLVVPNKSLSIFSDALVCWKGEKMVEWKEQLVKQASKFDFPIHKPYYELLPEQKRLLWTGNSYFEGLNAFFRQLEEQTYKIQYRVMLSRYRGKTTCPECEGTRLKKEAAYVKVSGKSVTDLVNLPITELQHFFQQLALSETDHVVAERLLIEINNRIEFLSDVGLGYLTLNRLSSTLSGGESQRINLATSLGSSLVGSMYILDEPSIGLHGRDTGRLIKVLRKLQQLGNSVIVVEHDEEIIRAADYLIDIGPLAGQHGGEVVFEGTLEELLRNPVSCTGRYLTGMEKIQVPDHRRKWNNYLEITGARENNLKGFDVKFPLNTLTVISGVSGSGKSSLIRRILYPALSKYYGGYGEKTGDHTGLGGDLDRITAIEFVDQNPIGKSSRSNPVTYLKIYDEIRKLYAEQPAAKVNGFTPSHFSFNIDGGRCETCQGEGEIKVEMQFMADILLTCESCGGKRFKSDVLDVSYRSKNIYELLELTVDEAIDFFNEKPAGKKIARKLQPLQDVGLGYVHLGQSSSTLSGGESQRVKLASFLAKEKEGATLFIFDEPTTGLHFHDIHKLLDSMNALISRGHTVLVIEHNPEVIKVADWVIDLGPDGGDQGGFKLYEGTPEGLVKCSSSFTGAFLNSHHLI